MSNALTQLLRTPGIWRAGDPGQPQAGHIASGFADLDAILPGGGWPNGALTELLHDHYGIGELRLFLPALARLSRSGRWIALIAPPHLPYAPALAAQGLDISRTLLVHPGRQRDGLWAVEQGLRSGTCAAVLAWPGAAVDTHALRRLQLAAEAGQTWGVLFRPGSCAAQASPCALRLTLAAEDDGLTRLTLLKCRGGVGGRELLIDLDRPRPHMLPLVGIPPHQRQPAGRGRRRTGSAGLAPTPRPQPSLPLERSQAEGGDGRQPPRLPHPSPHA